MDNLKLFQTPVLVIIFNRPETLKQIFNVIKVIKPKYLYVAADGPRLDRSNEKKLCNDSRDLILNNIDWSCEIKTLFQDTNLGCGRHVSFAVSWFFEHVEKGIILEDDCLPSRTFFDFCENLLDKYQFDEKIYMIGGSNFQKKNTSSESYYFSAYGHIWGWATWRRAWKKFDFSLKSISEQEFSNTLKFYGFTKQEKDYWKQIFRMMKYDPIDTWDYQWVFSNWHKKSVGIIPNINLIKNIGFNTEATHTKDELPEITKRKLGEIEEIIHPQDIKINRQADLYTYNHHFINKKTIVLRIWNKILRIMKKLIWCLFQNHTSIVKSK